MFAQHARRLFEAGFSIIPVNNKAPEIQNWQQYCKTMPPEEVFSFWEDSFKDHNLGVCLGEASGIVAFDYDYEGADSAIIENLIKGLLPPSPVRKVGRKGYTAFFRYSGQENMSVNRGKKRVFDFLSTGRQTVLPPSIHPMGMPYKWITPTSLEDIDKTELPFLDSDILNQLKTLLQSETEELLEERIVTAIPRHDLCVGYIFKSLVRMSTEQEIALAVVKYDKDNFLAGRYDEKPPYFEDSKYFKTKKPEIAALELVRRIVRWAKQKSARNGYDFKLGQKTEVATVSTGFHFVTERVNKKTGEVEIIRTPDYYGFAKWCQDNVNGFTDHTETFFLYEDGYFKPMSEIALSNFLINKSNDTVKPQEIQNFLKILKGKCFFEPKKRNDNLINFKNGVLNVRTKELTSHSPDYGFFYKIDIDYKKEATSPTWDKFLDNIFDGNQELIGLIHQIFGYTLAGGNPWLHKAFVFYGMGRNGKSTILNTLIHLLGRENTSNVPISLLEKPFSAIMLENKLANINEEMTEGDLVSSIFKDCISGGHIVGSKKFKDEKTFKVNARFIFATNKFPNFKDSTVGIDRRLVIIPFNKIIKESDVDFDLQNKLLTEISGILNKSLDGLESLINSGLIEPQVTKEIKNEYREESDQVYNWLSDNCEPHEMETSINELYNNFCNWCHFEGRPIIGKNSFVRRVLIASNNHHLFGIDTIRRSKNTQIKKLIGVKLKFST